MSTPCGHKKNTETVAQYRKRCGGRPLGMIQKVSEAPRKPRKKGQHRNSPNHSDLYTDENPKGTIHGLKFATVKDAEKSVSKIRNSGKSHAHKIQAAVAMEQRAREMGKSSQAAVYRKFINMMKKKTKEKNEQHTCHDCGQSIDINEAGFKFVIRNKKKVKKLICPPGTKAKGRKKCVRMSGKEKVKRAKGLKITRRKAKAKLKKTLRKRAKSMKKRQSMIGESLKLEELVGKPITEAQFDEAAGKKDACYHKVKARYDVWPSAYASGALVKCRKVGAKNWGNKSKKESVNEAYDIWAEDGSFGYTMTGIVEAEYQGRKVKLGKPMQGDVKKFKVYVKNPAGNVVKVNFGQGGDAKGGTMRIRKSNPKARAAFRARHNCDNPGPRHKARYWSCRKW